MFKILLILFLTFSFLGFGASDTLAQSRSKTEKQLKELRQKMEREEGRLRSVRGRKSDLEKALQDAQRELIGIEKNKLEAENVLIRLSNRTETLSRVLESASAKVVKQKDLLEKRVVAIYKMQRRLGALDFLMASSSAADLLKRSALLTKVTKHDNRRLRVLSELISEFRNEKIELSKLQQEKNLQLAKMNELEEKLDGERLKKASLLEEIRVEEGSRVASLRKLEKSAARLEKVLSKIMGGEPEEVVPEPKPDSKPEIPDLKPEPPDSKPTVIATPFKGSGLRKRRGKLNLPLGGKLVRTFGKQRHEEFSDVLFVKGLEFSDSVGASARSVAKGKVVLNQVLPGYGNVVILDHGKRYYTLYGLLASTLVQLGQVVSEGEVVGILGQHDARKRNFYFELRIKGKPVNPLAYFKKKPSKLSSKG